MLNFVKQRAFSAVILVVLFAPSLAKGQAFAPVAASEHIPNLDKLKDELKQYHDCTCPCGCYAKDLDLQADRAIKFLHKRAVQHPNEKLALVLDIDETTLTNYEEMAGSDFAYNSNAFNAWVESARWIKYEEVLCVRW